MLKMVHQAFSRLLFVLSLTLSVLLVSTKNSNVYVQCSVFNFTATTSYESNVNSLFASLIELASLYNFKSQLICPQNDGVYGLFQCRGDVTSPNCKDCVANAVNQLKAACPMSTGGRIQLERCLVKYDNTNFFGAQEKTEVCKKCGPSIGYNSDVSNRIDGALANLAGGNGQYFRLYDFGSMQGVAQCVQDLSLSDCEDCLSEASGRLRSECGTSTSGDMYLGKCYIRYAEDEGNENLANTSCSGESKLNTGTWIVLSVLSAFAGAFGGGIAVKLNIALKNSCNTTNTNHNNVTINQITNERDEYKKEAELARERAEKAEKIAEDLKNKHHESIICMSYGPPMPPPCPYLPHSNPNRACSFM